MAYKIKLKRIGREKFSKTFKVPYLDLSDAEFIALQECEKHLISRNVELTPISRGKYMVSAGFHKVGEVEIKKAK
jgi:hypothetical protein